MLLNYKMSEEFLDSCKPCRIELQRLSADELTQICKPCVVNLEKLPNTVFSGWSGRQITVLRLNSAQRRKFQRGCFEDERFEYPKERANYNRRKRIAMGVTQRSARRRGRGRRFNRAVAKAPTQSQSSEKSERSNHCHLFLAYSEMLAALSVGGDVSFLLTEHESLIVNSLLDLPNPVRAKIVEFTARTSSWLRVDSNEICSDWLERLVKAGIIRLATDYPDKYSDILNILTVPELKAMCKKAGLSSHFSKQSLIRELTIFQFLDVSVLQLPLENNEIYNLQRIVRLAEPVRQLITKTAHLFLLPIKDSNQFWAQSNPIYKIVRPCLPLNPELQSVKFDGYSEIFMNSEEFSRWAEARQEKSMMEKAITRKKWDTVESTVMDLSVKRAYVSPTSRSSDNRPAIFHQFSEEHVEIETLSLGVEALISSNTNLHLAEEILHGVLNQPDRSPEEKCSWRYQLALIFEKVCKPEKAADMALHAKNRSCGNCETCHTKLPQLCKRLSLTENLKLSVSSELIKGADDEVLPQPKIVVINRKSTVKGFPGLKSVYSIIKNGTKLHLSVEEYVMEHFQKNGYPKGLDDEGRMLMNLCNLVIWEETYSKAVPNVFYAPWQAVPFDWGTQEFWVTRQTQLAEKLQSVSKMTPEQLSSHFEDKRKLIGRVCGTVDWNFLNFDPKGILSCLTVPLFVAICNRLITGGFKARRGFPDLLLWNEEKNKCLFVEVKGPKDKLNSPQRSWLEFIKNSGGEALVAEVHG